MLSLLLPEVRPDGRGRGGVDLSGWGTVPPSSFPYWDHSSLPFSLFYVRITFKTSFGQKGILLLQTNLKKFDILSLCQKAVDIYFVCG